MLSILSQADMSRVERAWEPAYEHPDLAEVFRGFTEYRTYDHIQVRKPLLDGIAFGEEAVVRVNLCCK
jgi:hypothetical protein